MTKKLQDLEELIAKLDKIDNGDIKYQTTTKELQKIIARNFGYSKYIIKSTLEALELFGFIKKTNVHGVWKINRSIK